MSKPAPQYLMSSKNVESFSVSRYNLFMIDLVKLGNFSMKTNKT